MKLRYILIATIGLFGLISCEKSENAGAVLPEDNVIRIAAEVNAPATRAGAVTENLTSFGMFVEAPITSVYSYNNVRATKGVGDAWSTSLIMLWKNATDKVNMVAYAPYDDAFTDLTTVKTISVLADQSNEANVIESDFLYSTSSVQPSAPNTENPIHYADEKVNVKLNHHFSKLNLTITLNSEFFDIGSVNNPITNLKINGTKLSTTIDLKNGVITTPTAPAAITPFEGTYTPIPSGSGTGTANYKAIIIPQIVATNKLIIDFIVAGKRYSWKEPVGVTFAKNQRYALTLTVGKSAVVASEMTMGDWDNSADNDLVTE